MQYAKTEAPAGRVFVCPDFCGYQRRPLLNEDPETRLKSPYKCPECGRVGSLASWTRPWYEVDTTMQSCVEYLRFLTRRWWRRYCHNLAQFKLVVNRRGVYQLTGKLEPTAKSQCERGIPFAYSSRSFEGSGWTQVFLCEACVRELAEAGRKLADDFKKQNGNQQDSPEPAKKPKVYLVGMNQRIPMEARLGFAHYIREFSFADVLKDCGGRWVGMTILLVAIARFSGPLDRWETLAVCSGLAAILAIGWVGYRVRAFHEHNEQVLEKIGVNQISR